MNFAAALLVLLSTNLAFADDEAPTSVEVVVDAEAPVVMTPMVAEAPLPKACSNVGGYVEPALWGNGTDGELRHGLGIDAGRCTEVGLHVGMRFDVGSLGGFVGGEAELLFGRPGARIAFNFTAEDGSYARQSVGARLRLPSVWIGADVLRSTPISMISNRAEPTTTFMFGFGFGGDAGKTVARGELTALLFTAEVLGSVAAH